MGVSSVLDVKSITINALLNSITQSLWKKCQFRVNWSFKKSLLHGALQRNLSLKEFVVLLEKPEKRCS
nr:BPK_HP1_G0042960.mRNA.1.CDS.1 [Saccharomyces cerevisiae]